MRCQRVWWYDGDKMDIVLLGYMVLTDKSLVTKKVDGIKESSDSSTVLEDEDGQGNWLIDQLID